MNRYTMRSDSDTLEIALYQNMIRTATEFEDYPQLVSYFNDDKHQPFYVILTPINPFMDNFSIFRLDDNVTWKMNGNLLEIEQFTSEILSLKYGKRVLNWVRNISTAYINMKTEYYQE